MPPVLHIKLKIGNDLLLRLKTEAEKAVKKDDLAKVIMELGLDKDRKSDRKIYSELNGGDVKKFR